MKLYFDIDTQVDFMFPAGALYVPGAARLLPRIAQLNREAAASGAKLISTACAHEENDREFLRWPPHCVIGTVGQTRPCSLLLENRVVVPKHPADLAVEGADQIILEKDELDLFTNHNAHGLIEALAPEQCIVYGVVTEYCVKYCTLGLLDRGYKVTLVRDAIETLDPAVGERFLQDFVTRGGRVH